MTGRGSQQSKWERRQSKRLNRSKMAIHGTGNRLLARVIMEKAEKIRRKDIPGSSKGRTDGSEP